MRKLLLASAVLWSLTISATHAQTWIGNVVTHTMAQANERACMSGSHVFSPERTARVQRNVQSAMSSYIELARLSDAADVSDAFVRSRGLRRANGVETELESVNDPIARSFGSDAGFVHPESVLEAGDRSSAIAQWVIQDEGGERVGHYFGVFRRQGRAWRIVSLDVHDASAEPSPLTPYCHRPGDIERPPKVESEAPPPEDLAATPKP